VAPNGDCCIAGFFNSTNLDFGGIVLSNYVRSNSIPYDCFVARFSANGSVQWAKQFGGSDNDRAQGVAMDQQGNSYVAGYFTSTNISLHGITLTNKGSSVFLAKLDASGKLIWLKTPEQNYSTTANAVASDPAGNVFLAGSFSGTNLLGGNRLASPSSNGSLYSDAFLAKYDSNGNCLWARQAGGSSIDSGEAVAVDKEGNALLLASIHSTNAVFGTYLFSTSNKAGDSDIVVAKYNATGNLLWARQLGSESTDYGRGIAVDGAGNSFITGTFHGLYFSCGGLTLTNPSNAYIELFLAKMDCGGKPLWLRMAHGYGNDNGYTVASDQFGNAYVGGFFQNPTIAFESLVLTNYDANYLGDPDSFVVKFDPSGHTLWAAQVSGPSTQQIFSIALDPDANVYATGWTMGTNVLCGNHSLTNAYIDLVVTKLQSDYPRLQLTLENHSARVSWPLAGIPLTLQYSADLSNWFPVTQPVLTSGGQNVVSESVVGTRFYRAVHQ
jgi:hypothetical protein